MVIYLKIYSYLEFYRNVYVHPIPTKQFKWPVCRMLQEKFNVCDEYCLQFVQEVLVKEAVVLVFAARTGISTQEIRNICTSTEESLNLSGKVLWCVLGF